MQACLKMQTRSMRAHACWAFCHQNNISKLKRSLHRPLSKDTVPRNLQTQWQLRANS
ncbi:MAG: hypothetical protein E7312_00285 [Clostridiales bacterium]|nr:hypothetical protein [Clostridiales bacterium]